MHRPCRLFSKFLLIALVLLIVPSSAYSRNPKPDASLMDPATDSGRYLSVQDAETFLQNRWSAGFYLDYARKPLELRNIATNQKFDIVRDLLTGHFVGAYGVTDWFSLGASVPVVFWQTFFDPNVQRTTLGNAPKQQKFGLGDVRLEGKFQLVPIEKYNLGVALIPSFVFPTGKQNTFISGERWTPGIKLAIEGNIQDRVWLALNAGYQYVHGQTQFFAGNANAIIDDLLTFGLGARIRITDEWFLVGEALTETIAKNAFRQSTQSPSEVIGGFEFTPQGRSVRGLTFSLMGGGGITRGVGAPKAHVVFGVSYPNPKVVKVKEEIQATIEEKIVITQKIHFAFDSATIRSISYPILDDVAELLRSNPQMRSIRVEGHTDWIGSDDYNQRLSQKRSESVVTYLVGKGISRSRMIAVGYGEGRPIADNSSDEGRAKNRRTEFTVME